MSYVLTHPTDGNWDHSYSILSGHIKPNEPSPDYMKKFDEIICDFLREQGVPGASLYLTVGGKPFYRQGYGMAGNGELASSSSHYRIASISKTITAIAILRMCEQGRLQLAQTVFHRKDGILKELAPTHEHGVTWLETIKVLDLLHHSAGWDRDKVGDHVFWFQQEAHQDQLDAWDNCKLVQYVLSTSLCFKPGTKHAYSNFGYLVLGLIIEKVTGLTYGDFVKEILRELEIKDIFVGNTTQHKVLYDEVKYFNNKDPQVEKSVFNRQYYVAPQYGSFPMENTGPYGGWVTSARNLVTLLDNLIGLTPGYQCLLSDNFISEMFLKPKFEHGEAWYGLGLDVEDEGLAFGHTGAMEGTSTTVHHDCNGITWAFLLNSWAKDMDLDGLIKYALSSIYGLPMWRENELKVEEGDYFLMSEDHCECVTILLPHKRLLSHIMDLKSQGYKISQINALSGNNDIRFNIIWHKQEGAIVDWSVIVDVLNENFEQCLRQMKEHWKVIALESYSKGDECYHIFVFERCQSSDQKIYVVTSEEDHVRFKEFYESKHYLLQTQNTLHMGEICIITAMYDSVGVQTQPKSSRVWRGLSMEDFIARLATEISSGYNLRYIQFYTTDDMPRISAVWHKSVDGKKRNNCFQRHDVSKYGFLYELGESLKCNRPVSFVNAYRHEDVTYFAAIWETKVRKRVRNSSRNTKQSYRPILPKAECFSARLQAKKQTH